MSISTIDNAPEYIRFGVLQLSADGLTTKQLVEWLAGHGVQVSPDSVNYHLRKNGIYTDRKWWIDPDDTFADKMRQYIDALESRGDAPFRLYDLNLKGQAWGACTSKLLADGIIEKVPGQRLWYRAITPCASD